MTQPNIVLAGFMGTGKTCVGREAADRLGRRFLDMDDQIAQRAGKPVSAIFAEDGEPAFRALESALCRELSVPADLVIAAGGGAVVNPANRAALGAGGVIVCLEASPEAILERLAGQDDRPLLSGPDRAARLGALMADRAPAYAALPHHLDTTQLSVAAAAERVLGIAAGLPAGGYRLIVRSPAGAYDILIADGLLAEAGRRLLQSGLQPGRAAVITNPTVGRRYLPALNVALAEAGFQTVACEAPDGETYKTLETVGGLYERLAAARLSRAEPVMALGGGVIGDTAGFVAATWLRGVPFVPIPTSLLAMVDASVGGKVAVDLPQGKNLVGAFKQPALVLMDPLVLRTLPPAEYRSGMAEVLKTAIIGDPALFEALLSGDPPDPVRLIADTVRVKVRIVERDPFEMGDRAWLNLGHTFGHALELLSGYTLRHGEAVALGTIAATHLAAALGYCDAGLAGQVQGAVAHLGLRTRWRFDVEAALAAMDTDKKRRGRTLRFVVPRRIGEVTLVEDAPPDAVRDALRCVQETGLLQPD